MSRSSLSGTSTCDSGGRSVNEELGQLRQETLESIEQIQATLRLDKLREERELNEMRKTYDSLPPIPREPDNAAEMPEQNLKECAAFEEAKACKLDGELDEALQSCKQRDQLLLAEAAQLTRLADQLADSDSDEDNGFGRTNSELNEMRKTYDSLPPIPREPDNAAEMPEQNLKECIAFEEAKACKLEGDLHEALQSCKLIRQRAELLLAEAAQLTRLADQLADSDSDEDNGFGRTNSG